MGLPYHNKYIRGHVWQRISDFEKKIWSHDLGMTSLKRKSHKKSQHLLSWISIAMAFIPAWDESLSMLMAAAYFTVCSTWETIQKRDIFSWNLTMGSPIVNVRLILNILHGISLYLGIYVSENTKLASSQLNTKLWSRHPKKNLLFFAKTQIFVGKYHNLMKI